MAILLRHGVASAWRGCQRPREYYVEASKGDVCTVYETRDKAREGGSGERESNRGRQAEAGGMRQSRPNGRYRWESGDGDGGGVRLSKSGMQDTLTSWLSSMKM